MSHRWFMVTAALAALFSCTHQAHAQSAASPAPDQSTSVALSAVPPGDYRVVALVGYGLDVYGPVGRLVQVTRPANDAELLIVDGLIDVATGQPPVLGTTPQGGNLYAVHAASGAHGVVVTLSACYMGTVVLHQAQAARP